MGIACAKFLKGNHILESLDLSDNQLMNSEVADLVCAAGDLGIVSGTNSLKSLNLDGNPLFLRDISSGEFFSRDVDAATWLYNVLKVFTKLTYLNLSGLKDPDNLNYGNKRYLNMIVARKDLNVILPTQQEDEKQKIEQKASKPKEPATTVGSSSTTDQTDDQDDDADETTRLIR